MALHVVMGSFMFGCPYGPRDCSVSHFMIQKGTPHVSSTDFEESYSGQLSSNITSCELKRNARTEGVILAIIALSFVSYSSGTMIRDKEGEQG